jgi:hypothetical protein
MIEGCVSLNVYNNKDSRIRWLQMSVAEPLADCQIRRFPRSQGGGLGLYATEDIWHGQELLVVNREYCQEAIVESSDKEAAMAPDDESYLHNEDPPEASTPTMEDFTETTNEMSSIPMQNACGVLAGWRMHIPQSPWTDGAPPQQRTPPPPRPPVNNLAKWSALNAEYDLTDIPMKIARDV